MNFLADESVDRQIVDRLRLEGHKVLYVAEMDPGIPDSSVFKKTSEAHAVLVTADKDFGDMVFRQGYPFSGIILIRLAGLSPEAKVEIFLSAVNLHAKELVEAFTVITPGTVRIRRKPQS